MESVGNSGFQVISRKSCAHTGHIEIGFLEVTTGLLEKTLNVFFGFGMVNEFGLEHRENFNAAFNGKLFVQSQRIKRMKRLFNQFLGQPAELRGARTGRLYEDGALIEFLPAGFFLQGGAEIDVHVLVSFV
jgi:hypothetical protein